MARLVCVHEVELAEGADPDEFERRVGLVDDELDLPGWRSYLLKGERGGRAAKYTFLIEIESAEARDRYFPGDDAPSEEFNRWMADHPGLGESLERVHELEAAERTTDYLVVGDAGPSDVAPRMLAVHELELVEGADPEEFERRFVGSEAQRPIPGFRTHLLKGERGVRVGTYALLTEIDSVELRDRFFPDDGHDSAPFDRWMAERPSLRKAVEHARELLASDVTTDYLVVAE